MKGDKLHSGRKYCMCPYCKNWRKGKARSFAKKQRRKEVRREIKKIKGEEHE